MFLFFSELGSVTYGQADIGESENNILPSAIGYICSCIYMTQLYSKYIAWKINTCKDKILDFGDSQS